MRPRDLRTEAAEGTRLRGPVQLLDEGERQIVAGTVAEVCAHRDWELLAYQARTNHVHAVVRAQVEPERVLRDLKAWCTRRLVEGGRRRQGEPVWAHHGSTVYLWDHDAVERACVYVLEGQGEPLQ